MKLHAGSDYEQLSKTPHTMISCRPHVNVYALLSHTGYSKKLYIYRRTPDAEHSKQRTGSGLSSTVG